MKKTIAEKAAKFIRVLTVPPVMVTLFILVLWNSQPSVFSGKTGMYLSIVTLGFFPVLSYLVCAVIPALKKGGRDMQRRLAFVFTFIGYLIAWGYGHIQSVPGKLLLIYDTYFYSVILLLVLNFIFKVKASGHACSVSGPLALSVYFMGIASVFPCLFIEAASFWASVKSKRHTPQQFVIGAAVAVISFFASFLHYQTA